MDTLNKFKKNLANNSTPSSKITIKNYISDVKKFILWFESTFQYPFPPSAIPQEVVNKYLNEISKSQRSTKRYKSSLRKFFSYLVDEAIITYNPLVLSTISATKIDPWYLNDFKDFLYINKSSVVTIKNYIIDIHQFLTWAQNITGITNVFDKIDTFLIEEYKNRLIHEAKMSPLSVNRKLSALRKYLTWVHDKGILNTHAKIESLRIFNSNKNNTNNLSIEALQEPNISPVVNDISPVVSKFPPFRLAQKIKTGLTFVLDSLVVLSIFKIIEAIKYNFWKSSGRKIFQPIPIVLKSLNRSIDIPRFTAKHISAMDKNIINSIPKSIYAPLKISTSTLSFWKRISHHIKYTRPDWYKRYHSYSAVHYLHFAIVIVLASASGFSIYQRFNPQIQQKSVLGKNIALPSQLIYFKGRLTDSTNNPLIKENKIKFTIYNDPIASNSALLWHEIQAITPDSNGDFSATLGIQSPINQGLFSNNSKLFLGISVGNGPELTPRQEIATVELAKNSETLQGLKPITSLGAGTSNVILALDSSGNLTIDTSTPTVFQTTDGEFKLSGHRLELTTNPGTNTNVLINPDGTGIIDLQKPLQNTSNNNNLTSAIGAVEVDDNFAILASSSAQSAFYINQNSTGDLISASTSGIAKFTVTNQGEGTFASDLSILGNNLNTTTSTFNIANKNTIILNIGDVATQVSIASSSGTTTINNNLITRSVNIKEISSGVGTALVIDAEGNIVKSSSSLRYKTNVSSLQTDFFKLLEAQPVNFKYKDTNFTDIGYLAEDFERMGLKDLVIYDKSGLPDAIKYDKLGLYILEIVKAQQKKLDAFSEIAKTIQDGAIEVKNITANSLTITSENIMIGSQTLKDYISGIVNEIVDKRLAERDRDKITVVSPIVEAQIEITPTPELEPETASPSATPTSPAIATNSASPTPEAQAIASPSATPIPTSEPENTASESATASPNATPTPTMEPSSASPSAQPTLNSQLSTLNYTFPDGFISLGPVSLTDTAISTQLSIGTNLTINDNSINTLGTTLSIQPLRQGNLSIMGGLISIDTEGNLTASGNATFAKDVKVNGKLSAGIIAPIPEQDLVFQIGNPKSNTDQNTKYKIQNTDGDEVVSIDKFGNVVASGSAMFSNFKLIRGAQADTSFTETVASGSAGTATITANETERTVITPFVTENSLIYITPVSDTQGLAPYIARQTPRSFTIQIPQSINIDIKFNWIIIN